MAELNSAQEAIATAPMAREARKMITTEVELGEAVGKGETGEVSLLASGSFAVKPQPMSPLGLQEADLHKLASSGS